MSGDMREAAVRARRELRARLREGVQELTVDARTLNLLLDSVGQLQQSNDRMRRQNRRLRRKLAEATGESEGNADAIDADADAGADPDPEAEAER